MLERVKHIVEVIYRQIDIRHFAEQVRTEYRDREASVLEHCLAEMVGPFIFLVNGVDRMALIGAVRFPADAAITALEPAARNAAASPGAFVNDAILFGKWRD
jgi:hypothetical protein